VSDDLARRKAGARIPTDVTICAVETNSTSNAARSDRNRSVARLDSTKPLQSDLFGMPLAKRNTTICALLGTTSPAGAGLSSEWHRLLDAILGLLTGRGRKN
jgi:hypothetical protein